VSRKNGSGEILAFIEVQIACCRSNEKGVDVDNKKATNQPGQNPRPAIFDGPNCHGVSLCCPNRFIELVIALEYSKNGTGWVTILHSGIKVSTHSKSIRGCVQTVVARFDEPTEDSIVSIGAARYR
jgi:hypothetical protein